jgi:hypothetical protein
LLVMVSWFSAASDAMLFRIPMGIVPLLLRLDFSVP